MAELMNEFNAPLARFNPLLFDDFVDQLVLAVSEAVYSFGLRRVVRTSFPEPDTARCEKVANPVVAGLAVHIEAIVWGDIKGTKCFASLRRTPLQVLIKHLFPARRVHTGCVSDHTVEVEQSGVILVARDRQVAVLLPHRSLSICFAHRVILPAFTRLLFTAASRGEARHRPFIFRSRQPQQGADWSAHTACAPHAR